MNFLRSSLALVALAVLAGCDIPTDAPMVEQRWIVPLDNTIIPVSELLPDGVGVAGDLFAIEVDPFTTQGTLGELCGTCTDGPGPVPAFQGTMTGSQPLPADVAAVTLETGAIVVLVQNGFSFDPTQGGGSVIVTITDGPGGKVLGEATITTGLPAGSTVTRAITLRGGSAEPTLYATTVVTSVGGQNGVVDRSSLLTVNLDPTSVLAAFVTVAVAGRPFSVDPAELDVSEIDSSVTDRIESGGMKLKITNAFGVPMTVTLVITYPGGTLSRTLDVSRDAVSDVSVSYTGDEFRSFLGKQGVTLTGTGTVSGGASPITLRTDQELLMEATVDLTLVIG